MQSSLTILEPAKDVSLLTLYEARLALNLTGSVDATLDDQIEMIIEWSSAEIAALCNRTFARETLIETVSEIDGNRIYLTHWPVTEISVVDDDGTALVEGEDFALDANAGKITLLGSGSWGPVSITYTGGYDLPYDSPKALRHAAVLVTREAYYATVRGDATIRMISHKDSRVIYFDPNAKSGGSSSSGGSIAQRAIGDLLKHFMRFEV